MSFDPSTARPLDESGQFDPSTARPADEASPQAALRVTADVRQEDAAEVLRLKQKRPGSFDILYKNLADLKLQEAVDKADERIRTDPKLSAYIGRRPEIAPLVRDDAGPLAEIGRIARSWGEGATVGWTQAAKQEELADLLYVEATGGSLTEQQARRLADLEKALAALQADPRGGYAGGAARDQGYTARQIISSLKAYATGAVAGAAAGAAAGSVLPGVGNAAGGGAGMIAGGLVAGAAYSYKLETAFAYAEFKNLRDVNGQPLPPELARLGAQAVGAVNAIVETGSDVLLAGLVPGAKKAFATVLGRVTSEDLVKDALKRALVDPARRSVVVEGIRSMLAAGSLEGVEEFVQALVGAGVRELIQRASGQAFEKTPIGQDLEQAATEAFQAFRGTVLTAGAAVGAARGVALYRVQQEQQQATASAAAHAERLQLALREAGKAKARELAPEEFRAIAAEVTDGRSVYVAGDVLAQLPSEVLTSLPETVQAEVAAAAETGGLVKLDLADVLTVAPGTPLEQVVVEYGRATPESLTKAEVEDQAYMQARLQEEAQQIIAQAENETAAREEYLAVRDDFASQIAATGRYSQSVAASMAEFVASFYTVYAKRAGMSVAQMRAAYPMRVFGERSGVTSAPTDLYATIPEANTFSSVELDSAGDTVAQRPDDEAFAQSADREIARTTAEDKTGQQYELVVTARTFGVTPAITVEAFQPGGRRGFVDFSIRNDGVLTSENTLVAPAYRGRGLAEMMYRAARDAGYDIAPGRVQTDLGLAMVESLQKKGVINKEADGPRFRAGNIELLGQQPSAPRGTFNPRTFELLLNPNADLSTWFHETGHFFLEVLADLATQPNARPELVADFQTLLRWFGVPDAQTWHRMTIDEKRPYHERFAESVEQYVLEGRVPNADLQPLMRRFAAWLKSVYRSIQKFLAGRPDAEKMPLNDDVRRVMDRMLATDEQIAEAEQRAGLDPDPEATAEAQERLRARSMRDLKWVVNARDKVIKRLRKEAQTVEKQIREEVTAAVEQMPVVRAAAQLAELQAKHEADPTAADMNVAVIADANGFASVDAMYREIERFGDKQAYIDSEVQRRMLEEHGELVDERAIAEAANEAVHNEARARALATELKAQEEMLNARRDTGRTNAAGRRITVNAITEAAKAFAADALRNVPLRDLREAAWRHTVAEREAARRWRRATAAGKTEEAVKAKRDQVLHNAAAKAALEAQAEVKKAIQFFRRVTKGNDEKVVEKGRDPALVNAARAVLGAYGVQTPTTKRAPQYLELVAQYDPETAAVLQPMVQEALDAAQPLDSLTLAEFRDVAGLIDQLWHLARETRQLEVAGKKVEIDAAADDLYARMAAIGIPDVLPGETRTVTKAEQRKQWLLQDAPALLRRVEAWAEAKDGKWGGPFTRLIFQPVKDAADKYRAERVKYRERFAKLIEQNKDLFKTGPIEAPEIGYVFGAPGAASGVTAMSELLHALLHTGNSSNKAKLLAGRGWGVYDPQTKTLDTTRWDSFIARLHREGVLTKRHWDFVQAVWDLLEELKPAAQETHRKVFGRHFAEVTAEPVVTPFGVYRGGYAPAQIDPRLVKDGELKKNIETENANASFIFPQTNRGFTMSRVEAYRRPLLLDLRTFTQHIDKVLLFTHLEPAVRQTHRLLRHKTVSSTLNRVDPAAINAMLLPWLNRSARQVVETTLVADAGIGRALALARARAGMGLMFANVINALQQVTALSTALVKVNAADMARATAQYIQRPVETTHAVWDKSPAMRDRAKNEVAVLADTMAEVLINPSIAQNGEAFARKHAYFMQTAIDTVTATITWRAAYNQALRRGLDDESAVRFADSTVRQTHGSTLPEDVSRFETGHPAWRLFAQFMGYFNMLANTNATAVKLALQESGAAAYGRAAYLALVGLLVPIWVAEAIAQALRGGPDDGDDDGELIDDWIAAVFGFGTLKGLTAMAPGLNWLGQLAAGQFTDSPADDKLAMAPTISLAERAIVGNVQTLKELADEDKEVKWQRATRDAAALFTLLTGWPLLALARPAGYLAGVAQGRIEPTSELDLVRGVVTGAASPESKQ